jgi:UDP-GlcNAc3NAcA epimerase
MQKIVEEIIHTGQHFSHNMSQLFFDEMGIPEPVANLQINSGLHGEMTGQMLESLEKEIIKRKPDWLLVYGDTNSTLAAALAASKLHVPVAHVET